MNYIELPLSIALKHFPFLKEIIVACGISLTDDSYIVRISKDFNIEIGYRSDSWSIA